MATFLFDKTVFGPVKSRRLGVSLGINLLPNNRKLCSFDCVYCECGWNSDTQKVKAVLPSREQVKKALEEKLMRMVEESELPDVITFAGNGEPTMHPNFADIITDTVSLRNRLTPKARIAVLSNSSMLFKPEVVEALKIVDDNILKLDSGIEKTIRLMNCPASRFGLNELVKQLSEFKGALIIQTMFLRGSINNEDFDNTTNIEVEAWIELLKIIKPAKVMIYTIARDTPLSSLIKITTNELNIIASKVETLTGIKVDVSG